MTKFQCHIKQEGLFYLFRCNTATCKQISSLHAGKNIDGQFELYSPYDKKSISRCMVCRKQMLSAETMRLINEIIALGGELGFVSYAKSIGLFIE